MNALLELDPQQLAKKYFGFDALLPGQHEVITHLLAGKSAAAIFPTGGGKSLCYQLPALTFDGLTLVVSPLLALMRDQIDALKARGIIAHRLDSTLSLDEYRGVMDDIRQRRAKLLYVAPERFNNERFRYALKGIDISLFAIDEAHCISEWGHNFRPDYLKLKDIAKESGAKRILALTATATPSVVDDISNGFAIESECVVRTPFYRENLELLLTPTTVVEREQLLVERLRTRARGPTLIYVTLQKTAEFVARRLSDVGFPARAYHAGMKPEVRGEVQDAFLKSEDAIVVATIAFGMGVDKSNIRQVLHWNLPKSLENLAQEIGRAGRDGAHAFCETFVCADDLTTLENFAYGDTPTETSLTLLLRALFDDDDSRASGDDSQLELDMYALSKRTDIRPLVLKTLLTWLELDGWLRGGTPLYVGYRFKPIHTGAEILGSIKNDDKRDFLHSILRLGKKKKTWIDIDVEECIAATGATRQRVVAALDWLGDNGHVELKPQGVRNRYRIIRTPDDLDSLSEVLAKRMLEREMKEVGRLSAVLDLAEQSACQVRTLGSYFGDDVDTPCGHCSYCLNGAVKVPPRISNTNAVAPALEKIADDLTTLAREHPQALGHPRQRARFISGLGSPAVAAARLGKHALCGALDGLPFAEVLRALESR